MFDNFWYHNAVMTSSRIDVWAQFWSEKQEILQKKNVAMKGNFVIIETLLRQSLILHLYLDLVTATEADDARRPPRRPHSAEARSDVN